MIPFKILTDSTFTFILDGLILTKSNHELISGITVIGACFWEYENILGVIGRLLGIYVSLISYCFSCFETLHVLLPSLLRNLEGSHHMC